MKHTAWTLVAAFLLPATGTTIEAQELSRVHIEDSQAPELAVSFQEMGLDVLWGSVEEDSLELVVSEASLSHLDLLGYEPVVLERGRPFAEIQAERLGSDSDSGEDMVPAGYPTLPQVISGLGETAGAFPSIAQAVDLSTRYGVPLTANGRKVWAMKISDNVTAEEDEPAILLLSGCHGREVAPVVITLDIIERLTTGYGVDPEITRFVDNNEIWVLPLANPDGYAYVFNFDNLWKKNRMPYPGGVGVDLNRNFDFGWEGSCAGSTNVADDDYKGPSVESEVETQAIVALSREQNFAKVLDFHSFGERVRYEYACGQHPLAALLRNQATELSNLAGWGGRHGTATADGMHLEWQLAEFSAYSFHVQVLASLQVSYSTAVGEAAQVWPLTHFMLDRFIDVSGHVTDRCTGNPVVANITYVGLPFVTGEQNRSEALHGRYHAWLPEGQQTLRFSAPGYVTRTQTVTVLPSSGVTLDMQLEPIIGSASAVTRNGTGANPTCYTTVNPPVLGTNWVAQVDHGSHPGATFTAIVVHFAGSSGTFLSGGEVLVDLGTPRLAQSLQVATGISDTHSNFVPNDPCLGNRFVATQAVILGGGYELCNAEDLTSGF